MRFTRFLVLLFTLILSACSGSADPSTEINVTMTDFSFSPSSITITAGQPVVLTFKNDGQVEHDFVVEKIDVSAVSAEGSGVGEHHMGGEHMDYDLHISTKAAGTSVLKFTANEPGTYRIFCSVEGHEQAGMVGELIVVSK